MKKIVLGSGGSAFVDGGFGSMTLGLGIFRAINSNGQTVDLNKYRPKQLRDVSHLELLKPDILKDLEIIMPCDVQNPMLGLNGAAFVFGP